MKWKNSKTILFILLGLLFLSHLPFIEADPDRNMAVGRGPFTDEGLNTIQIRNWVNHGTLDLSECDNLLKTPLLGFPLALTYTVFGTGHIVSRLHVLVLLFLALLMIGLDKKHRWIIIVLSLISLFQYQVFQSSHFSMAEMLSVASVLLSIHFLARSFDPEFSQKKKYLQAIASGLFLSFAYYFKIQFLYLIIMLPAAMTILWFATKFLVRKAIIRQGFAIASTLLFFLLLYLFAWYLPNKEAYDYMMVHQSGGFDLSEKTGEYIRFNLTYHFLRGWFQWFVYIFLALLVMGFIILKRSTSRRYTVLFFSSLVWFLLELHKLTMVYLPTRYQVSLMVSMGLLMSVVSCELRSWPNARARLVFKVLTAGALIIMVVINGYHYTDTLRHRTFAIRDTNNYLAKTLDPDDVVLGAWAPSLTWESRAKALPVWNNFLNYQDPVNKFQPRMVIAETDEQDSEQAWSSQGISLQEISDSTKTVKIGHWVVEIYWLKPKL
jgi:hypothetical protein